MADARKNTLLYHFNAMNVVKGIQNILKCKPPDGAEDVDACTSCPCFSAEEIHKVLHCLFYKKCFIISFILITVFDLLSVLLHTPRFVEF